MCIAILCPKGKTITKEQFINSWENNYNGAGFMYNDNNNKLRVVKEMKSAEKLYGKYVKAVKKFPNATFALHFRISNRGVINRANCHPFKVTNELGFIHNGTVLNVDNDDELSDTNIFNRTILRKLPGMSIEYLKNKAVKAVLEEFIGRSKMVFLDNFGNYAILNEKKHQGYWEKGIWYSNDSHERISDWIDSGGKKIRRAGSTPGYSPSYSQKNYADRYSYPSHYDGYPYQGVSSLNSPVSDDDIKTVKDMSKEGEVDFKLGLGTEKCSCCGADIGKNELLNAFGECMECCTDEEAINIAEAAVSKGHILADMADGSIVSYQPEQPEVEKCECDSCLEVHPVDAMYEVPSWRTILCESCAEDMVDQDFLEPSDIIGGEMTGSCHTEPTTFVD